MRCMIKEKDIKIVFWGTPEFALPSLEALIKEGYKIKAVVTNPDEPKGRRKILSPPPVKIIAKKHNIPVLQPSNQEIKDLKLQIPAADLYIVSAYGKIIPKAIFTRPAYQTLVIHPSLLPRWRGASPIQFTILNGDKETGVTIIKMDEQMDHGPIIAQKKLADYNAQEASYKVLYKDLAELSAKVLLEILPKYLSAEITAVPQDETRATYSKMLKKEDGRINWNNPASEIERMVRAFNPWPGSWTIWPHQGKNLRIKIEEAGFVKEEPPGKKPGYAWRKDNRIFIKTGFGSLEVKRLTPEGKKLMDSIAFANGYPDFINSLLLS